jgi:hypothetical protein
MKAIELRASVEWDESRSYDHAEVEVARAPWFSRRWTRTRSPAEALRVIEEQVIGWLREAE